MKRFILAAVLLICSVSLAFARQKPAAEPSAEFRSQWLGKRVAFLGDSITDKAQVEKGVNDTYWKFLVDILGIEPYVYGINGHQSHQIIGQAKALEADHGQDFDAIMVFVGTNDYNASLSMGEWYSYHSAKTTVGGPTEVVRLQREFNFDGKTYKGRLNSMMLHLKTHFPDKQIILLTPIHRAYAEFSPKNIQPDESYANGLGLFIDDYVQAVKETANVWAVPVIDLNSICGLMPVLEQHHHYFRDKDGHDYLHPNTEGHRRMAYCLAYQLLAYPSCF